MQQTSTRFLSKANIGISGTKWQVNSQEMTKSIKIRRLVGIITEKRYNYILAVMNNWKNEDIKCKCSWKDCGCEVKRDFKIVYNKKYYELKVILTQTYNYS